MQLNGLHQNNFLLKVILHDDIHPAALSHTENFQSMENLKS